MPGPWHAETVLDLVLDAESRDLMDPDANEDLVRWTRLVPEADTAVEGVPEYPFGPRRRDARLPYATWHRAVQERGLCGLRTGHATAGSSRAAVSRPGQRRPAKRSFSGTSAPVVSWTRAKVSTPINSPNLSLPILRKKMFSL